MQPIYGQDTLEQKLDRLFQNQNPRSPGVSAALFSNGQVLYQKSVGIQRIGQQNISNHSNFRLASLSKAFTAIAALLLIDEGKLTLESRLTDVFPDFPQYGRNIRIRHLLHHQAGMKDYEDLVPSGRSTQVSDADVLALMRRQQSTYFTPGSQYRYSNTGYCILAEVVHHISGMSFADFMKERVFSVLRMDQSQVYQGEQVSIANRAYGHSSSGSGYRESDQNNTSATSGDGGVYSSIHDLALWDEAMNTNPLLRAETFDLVFKPGRLNNGSSTGYGLGWMLGTLRNFKRVYHTGSSIGFRTAIDRLPEVDVSAVALANRSDATPWSLTRQMLEIYLTHQNQ